MRRAGTHVEFVLGQIRAALKGWNAQDVARIVIAYEPIWARAVAGAEHAG